MNPTTGLAAKLLAVAAVTAAGAGVGWVAADRGSDASAQAAPAGSWVDWPLDGAVLDVQPISVVTHVADPDGLRAVDLSVDGNLVASRAASGTFAQRDLNWDPLPGEHVLIVAALGADGDRTASAPLRVRVGADDETASPTTTAPNATTTIPVTTTTPSSSTPLTTSVPTTTTLRPATTSPPSSFPRTTTPPTSPPTTSCTPAAPTPTAPQNGSIVVLSAMLQWTAPGCTPTSYRVDVSRDPAFARLEHTATVAHPALSWSTPTLPSCVTWYWRVAGLGPTPGPWSATATFSTFLRGC